VHRHRLGHIKADLEHALLEEFAILALVDGVRFRPDHFHPVLGENAGLVQLHREVERCLAASVGSSADGFSFAMIFSRISSVSGSMYVTSANSGSVMMVAGLELTRMTRNPPRGALAGLRAGIVELRRPGR